MQVRKRACICAHALILEGPYAHHPRLDTSRILFPTSVWSERQCSGAGRTVYKSVSIATSRHDGAKIALKKAPLRCRAGFPLITEPRCMCVYTYVHMQMCKHSRRMLNFIILTDTVSHDITSHYIKPGHVILCFAMLCYVTPCYTKTFSIILMLYYYLCFGIMAV